MRRTLLFFILSAALSSAGALPPEDPPQPSVFHSGTRLVEIDVVVHGKDGPVTGLTKEDFSLWDCNQQQRDRTHPFSPCKAKRQPIDVFREVTGAEAPPALTLVPGVSSNRGDQANTTVVLLDQLHTPFDLKAYERLRVAEFLKAAAGDNHRFALYSLGQGLHLLQDFTDDPKKLMDAIAKEDSGDQLAFAQNSPGVHDEFGGMEAAMQADMKEEIATPAIKAIIRHMEGVQGRKNLVWIAQQFPDLGDDGFGHPRARTLLAEANIAVYPVMVRSHATVEMYRQSWRNLGKSVGGAAFDDAADAMLAVRDAEEESKNYYVLGFYPAETGLDGKTHQLTLEVSPKALASKGVAKSALDLRYKQLYVATKSGSADPEGTTSITDMLTSPMDSSTVGLTGMIAPDPTKPGARRLEVIVNLANVQLQREGDRWVGSLQLAMRLESKDHGVTLVTPPATGAASISLTDDELQAKRGSGYVIVWPLAPDAKPGSAHVVVQDAANGAAGSVRVPIPAGNTASGK